MSASNSLQQHLSLLVETFSQRVPFHRVIGLQFIQVNADCCRLQFTRRDELIGNYVQGILHGGVIATVLDVAGGSMAAVGLLQKHHHRSQEEIAERLSKLGTIDLRIDYLRPGRGELFTASATLLRGGNKVAVARAELHNEREELIAVGTGTYLVGLALKNMPVACFLRRTTRPDGAAGCRYKDVWNAASFLLFFPDWVAVSVI